MPFLPFWRCVELGQARRDVEAAAPSVSSGRVKSTQSTWAVLMGDTSGASYNWFSTTTTQARWQDELCFYWQQYAYSMVWISWKYVDSIKHLFFLYSCIFSLWTFVDLNSHPALASYSFCQTFLSSSPLDGQKGNSPQTSVSGFLSGLFSTHAHGSKIILEALVGLVLGIVGASLNTPPLKEITWASEFRKRYGTLPHNLCMTWRSYGSRCVLVKSMRWTHGLDLRPMSTEGTNSPKVR